VWGLGTWLATDLAQAGAEYALRCNYARAGTWAVVRRVSDPAAPSGRIGAPQAILYHARRAGWYASRLFCATCRGGEVLAVLEQCPAFIILTEKEAVRSRHLIAAPTVAEELGVYYNGEQVGSYLVYTRRGCAGSVDGPGTVPSDYQP